MFCDPVAPDIGSTLSLEVTTIVRTAVRVLARMLILMVQEAGFRQSHKIAPGPACAEVRVH